ncbi:ExeM/NucH family extracellular endonuclease [Nesterenkonia lacusekhoensis]|uniref:Extracellular nuclease n=1 Tax=Nesterenkonia lacusekhoensis TaxID=150832 RepID=A0ABS4SYQ7_9MICC|nr:ExeM/NucH family extracellular endonuclease [Nesterenkonia lacusekhoensis]MBP2317327.1 putative extracellular nuclease [Nesterenkonia lacusekhoensis]
MPTPDRPTTDASGRRLPRLLTAAVLSGTMLGPAPAMASPAQDAEGADCILIDEVNTRGGSSAQDLPRYVELTNSCDTEVDLSDWSIQGYQSSGTPYSGGNTQLSGSVPAEGSYLILGPAAAGGPVTELHADHVAGAALNMAGGGASVALFSTAEPPEGVSGDLTDHPAVVDALGWGEAEVGLGDSRAVAAEASSGETLQRTGSSGENGEDFGPAPAAPRYSGGDALITQDQDEPEPADPEPSEPAPSEPEPSEPEPSEPEPSDPTDSSTAAEVSISEVRGEAGTDPAASPYMGEEVTTRGVVTARYADTENTSRPWDGFYLQEEAACGSEDYSDHDVSCAVFVWMGTGWDGAVVEEGDYVEVTGEVGTWEESSSTSSAQLQITQPEVGVIEDESVDAPLPYPVDGFLEIEEREQLIGMTLSPEGDWTVTDNYGLLHGEADSVGGVLGVVDGTDPLVNPTAQHHPDTQEREELAASNAERYIRLGHGGRNRWTSWSDEADMPLPYLSTGQVPRVGTSVEWNAPVILEHRYDEWRFEPTSFLPGNPEQEPVTFSDTRPEADLPGRAGDVRVAGFNVLNYFPHVGEYEEDCDYHEDRHGEPTTTDYCTSRGAYTEEHFAVQQQRIVNTIVGMDADVIALQEMENSVHFGEDRDYAHQVLVEALNAVEGEGTWDYVPVEDFPEDEDVIRNGYIYRPEAVELVDSLILFEEGVEHLASDALDEYDVDEIYSNAREPMAALFQPVDGDEDDQFALVVNHLKSKGGEGEGDNADSGDGSGSFNGDRTRQAEAMVAFTEAMREEYSTDRFYLMGDFNSYAAEAPMVTIEDAGFTNLSAQHSEETGNYSYNYSGESGSLDHVVASDAAVETVAQTHIWNTNAPEPIALEYSRYEASGTPGLYDEPAWSESLWRASDHDPIIADIVVGEETDGGAEEEGATEEDDAGQEDDADQGAGTGSGEDGVSEDGPSAGEEPVDDESSAAEAPAGSEAGDERADAEAGTDLGAAGSNAAPDDTSPTAASSEGDLALTGAQNFWIAAIAAGLLGVGTLLAYRSRLGQP